MTRRIALALLIAVVSTPLLAFDRGNVLLEDRTHISGEATSSYDLWLHVGWHYATWAAWALNQKAIPFVGPGHFLMPSESEMIFHDLHTVSVWDGAVQLASTPGKGYTDIFTDDAELAEIAPMRSGSFLVAERWADVGRGAKLIEFNLQGRVAEFPFPTLIDAVRNKAIGATHIELLADQCTLLYTLGSDDPSANRVRRMNICTQQPQTDFASLIAGQYEGSIRQLPNGDVLVANGSVILRFSPSGSLRQSYEFPGVSNLALATNGDTFWAAGVDLDTARLVNFDLSGNAQSIPLGNPEMQTIIVPQDISDLVVVGEWRAATNAARQRTVRRRR